MCPALCPLSGEPGFGGQPKDATAISLVCFLHPFLVPQRADLQLLLRMVRRIKASFSLAALEVTCDVLVWFSFLFPLLVGFVCIPSPTCWLLP